MTLALLNWLARGIIAALLLGSLWLAAATQREQERDARLAQASTARAQVPQQSAAAPQPPKPQ